jgi:hypothetical protein
MSQSTYDTGVITALLERLNSQRLPRALALKDKVDAGGTLDGADLDFLKEVFADTGQLKPLMDRHPEYQGLVARVLHLYHEITAKALENEQRR